MKKTSLLTTSFFKRKNLLKILLLIFALNSTNNYGQLLSKKEIKKYLEFKYLNKYEIAIYNKTPFELELQIGNNKIEIPSYASSLVYKDFIFEYKKRNNYKIRKKFPEFWSRKNIKIRVTKKGLDTELQKIRDKAIESIKMLYAKNAEIKFTNKNIDALSETLGSIKNDNSVQKIQGEYERGNTYERDESMGEYFGRKMTTGVASIFGQVLLESSKRKVMSASEIKIQEDKIRRIYTNTKEYLTNEHNKLFKKLNNKEFNSRIKNKIARYKGLTHIIDLHSSNNLLNINKITGKNFFASGQLNLSLGVTPEFKITKKYYTRIYAIASANAIQFNFLKDNSKLFFQNEAGEFNLIEGEGSVGTIRKWGLGFGQVFLSKEKTLFFGYDQIFNLSNTENLREDFENNVNSEFNTVTFNNTNFLNNSSTRLFLGVLLGERKGIGIYVSAAAIYNNLNINNKFLLFEESSPNNFSAAPQLSSNNIDFSVGLGFSISLFK